MVWYEYEYAFLTKCVAGIFFLVNKKEERQLTLAAAFTLRFTSMFFSSSSSTKT